MLRALPIALLSLVLAAPADAAIRAPRGIDVQNVARGLGHPTAIAFDPAGGIWTTSAPYGVSPQRRRLVRQAPRRAAAPRGQRPEHRARADLVPRQALRQPRRPLQRLGRSPTPAASPPTRASTGGASSASRTIVKGIPTGQHRVNNIVPGPGGRLYIGVGSAGDTTAGSRYGGTVVSFKPGGGGLRIEARGLRNPYGLAFAPDGATLLVSDNGRDDLGNDRPPEELNRFVVDRAGAALRLPALLGSWTAAAARARAPPFAELAPHSAVGGVATVERFGRFGPSAFVAEHGSTIASPPTGSVVRARPAEERALRRRSVCARLRAARAARPGARPRRRALRDAPQLGPAGPLRPLAGHARSAARAGPRRRAWSIARAAKS